MANEQNLKPFNNNSDTVMKQREIQRKGGIASGIAKRQRKTFAQIFETILEEEAEVMINGEKVKITKKDLLARDLINKAIKNQINSGTLNGLKHIQATVGESPIERIEQTTLNISTPQKADIEELKKIRKEVFGK